MIEIDDSGFYVTSDWHLYHKNIIGYCDRPFDSVDEMNKTLFENWNNTVSDNDTIFFLGDFLMGGHGVDTAKVVWENLAGKKYFIQGNHDKKIGKFCEDVITENSQETVDVLYKGKIITLGHYPNLQFSGEFLIHGHTHNNRPDDIIENRFNASCELTDYKPIHIDEVLDRINVQNENL